MRAARGGAGARIAQYAAGHGLLRGRTAGPASAARPHRRAIRVVHRARPGQGQRPAGGGAVHLGHGGGQLPPGRDRGRRVLRSAARAHRRPAAELRGIGANQAIDQIKLYGTAVRWFCEAGLPEARPGMVAYWRSLACQAWAHAAGSAGGLAGPVHLNLPFREPLVPGEEPASRGQRPWTDGPAASRGPTSAAGRAPAANWSCPGPSAGRWSAGTATMTRSPWLTWR